MNVLQMPIKLTNRKVWYHMKEIDYENDIKKVYQQLHVDKHQVTVLKQRLEKEKRKNLSSTFQKYAAAAVICLIVLAGGGAAVAAVVQHWNDYMKNNYHVTDEQISKYEEQGLLNQPDGQNTTCTKNGVKVTVLQTVVDSYYAFVSLKVTGYNLDNADSVPEFDEFNATIDGKKLSGWNDFYDGTVTDENGQPILPNGETLSKNADGSLIFPYAKEDGSLEYNMLFTSNGKENYFLNKTINITLTNLGQYIHGTDSQMENMTSATWKLEAPLAGNSSKYNLTAQNNMLGETGISVGQIQLSPLSVNVTLKSKKNISHNMIPNFEGVKMKNGTIYLCGIDNTLSSASKKSIKSNDVWKLRANVEGIIDVNEVESLLFDNPKKYVGITEDEEIENDENNDYYEIKIKPE